MYNSKKPVNSVIEPLNGDGSTLSRKEKRSLKQKDKKKTSCTKKKSTAIGDEELHDRDKENESNSSNKAIDETNIRAANGPTIVATSQQSRFHTVTYDEFGKNVLLNQFTLSIVSPSPSSKRNGASAGGTTVELLRDTQLKLNYGTKYGLIGPNGIGKSTLLQALADGLVENLPSALKILYVNQLDTSSFTAETAARSVLQTVLDADTRVADVKSKLKILQPVLLGNSDYQDTNLSFVSHKVELLHALLRIRLVEAEEAVEAAAKTAIKRSGMRGKDARLRLLEAEHKVATLKTEVACLVANADKDPSEAGDDVHQLLERVTEADILRDIHEKIQEYQMALKNLDEASMEARARRILSSMGVDAAKQEASLSSLSGGWQVRILLARVLFMEPDFLLLDEPTNHLDMPSILWLKDYLLTLEDVLGSPVTIVLVSHDRFFLNAIAEEIILFRGYDKTLAYFDGNYDSYEETMVTKKLFNERLQIKLDQKTEKMTKTVAKMAQQGAKAKDDKKLAAAASKKKKMERIGNEVNEKGHRFKLNRDRAGYHFSIRDGAEDTAKYETETSYSSWKVLAKSPPQIRNLTNLKNTTMVSLENVSFRYNTSSNDTSALSTRTKASTPLVMENLNLTINYGEKVILVGRNGAGKTTLMKLLNRVITPTSGKPVYFHGARVSSLMQHNVEDLKRHEWSRRLTPLELLRKTLENENNSPEGLLNTPLQDSQAREGKLRAHLSSFGISGDTAAAVPLESLSGGQLVRVGLAYATFPYPPHVLLLDEPTNHLDMSTIQLLGEALRNYEGAIVLISHDVHFLEILCGSSRYDEGNADDEFDDKASSPIRVLEVSKKKGIVSIQQLENGVDAYREKEERRNASLGRV